MWLIYESMLFPRVGTLLSGLRRPVRLDPGY